jgi:hypothetical protein
MAAITKIGHLRERPAGFPEINAQRIEGLKEQ